MIISEIYPEVGTCLDSDPAPDHSCGDKSTDEVSDRNGLTGLQHTATLSVLHDPDCQTVLYRTAGIEVLDLGVQGDVRRR